MMIGLTQLDDESASVAPCKGARHLAVIRKSQSDPHYGETGITKAVSFLESSYSKKSLNLRPKPSTKNPQPSNVNPRPYNRPKGFYKVPENDS